MRLIGDGAEVGIDEGNQVINEHTLERVEVEGTKAAAPARTRSGTVRRASSSRGRVRPPRAAAERIAAVFHHDDEGLRFSLDDQVVHDKTSVALPSPAGFIFARAVLQIQHRVALARVLVIVRWGVNKAVAVRVVGFREVMNLAKLAMRNVLQCVEVPILGRHFDRAAPPSGTVKEHAVGIRNIRPVNIDRVIVKAFVQWPRVTDPGAVLTLRKGAAISETHSDALG